ncbi:lysophospholipid acyltransferase family protein [Pontibacillus sp. HMF3514]|uniref:lysophospholipid acyltransferase family protein n=1 Tax=Pontibacillus sp. HMF3514 TaxID=2692425 RepID=UPI00131F5F10|nr:lysophospholipid acyltransferase family protein [Pontibacillus sp. HMF3514]QHE51976.1 glycerol acyltransferase [Pontibacillus sp. HMF3514]
MIPAKKNRFWAWGFDQIIYPLLKKHFQEIYVYGSIPQHVNRTLYIINHSVWWDPILIYLLNQKLIKSDGYAMMHESGLRKHPIFKRIGGFSIDRNNPKDIIESLQYAVEKLHDDKSVWMFPQGDEQPFDQRPLGFQSGASYIIEKVQDLNVIPISIMYTFQSTKKANIYVFIGSNPMHESYASLKREDKTRFLEQICTQQLDTLKQRVLEQDVQDAIPLLRRNQSG